MKLFIEKLLFGKSNKLFENILLCIAITLACSFIYYDMYNSFMEVVRIISIALIFIIWIIGAFSSGKNKQWKFLLFTGLYWLLPHLYMVYYNMRDNVRGYSKWLSMLNKTSDILVNKPFSYLAEKTECQEYIYATVLVIIAFSTYFIGMNLKSIMKNSKKNFET